MLFVVCYTQPVNRMEVLPLTSVVPSTFSSIGQHSIYSFPRESSHSQCSVHPFIPLCPVLLIFIHQFVYTTQGSGKKRQKYLLRHIPWSCWGCQNMELTGSYLWPPGCFNIHFPKLHSCYVVSCLFCQLLRLEKWNRCYMPKHTAIISMTLEGKS